MSPCDERDHIVSGKFLEGGGVNVGKLYRVERLTHIMEVYILRDSI